jgi:hypothetical protein
MFAACGLHLNISRSPLVARRGGGGKGGGGGSILLERSYTYMISLPLWVAATLHLSDFLFPNKFYDFFSEEKRLEILVSLVQILLNLLPFVKKIDIFFNITKWKKKNHYVERYI